MKQDSRDMLLALVQSYFGAYLRRTCGASEQQGVDLHSRLPWLSAYLGHVNLLGTEKYLAATPELLSLAANRFRRLYTGGKRKS